MWRTSISTLVAVACFSSVAAAQQPCTTDANRVVSEIYRHVLERDPDPASAGSVQLLASGGTTVRDLVRGMANSAEHTQRFFQPENGEAVTYERGVASLYRHMVGRQPDPAVQRTLAILAQRSGVSPVIDRIATSPEYLNSFGDWVVPGSGGLRYCGTTQSANAAPPVAQAAAAQTMGQRFRRMDTNSDGRISNREWQGTRETFRVQDWNNDGVLADEEVRGGAGRGGRSATDDAFNRRQRFETLDVNNNNQVDFNEWQGSVAAFDRLDRNTDGILSRGEINSNGNGNGRGNGNGNGRGEQGAAATTGGGSIVVDPKTRWTDSGFDVRAGDTLQIRSDGSVRLSNNGNDFATPAGSETGRRIANSPLPTAAAGGLVARIGNAATIFVGNRRSIVAPTSGRLFFGVNDDRLQDNSGAFNVEVSIR